MDSSPARQWIVRLSTAAVLLVGFSAASTYADEKYTLSESVTDARVYDVASRFELTGTFQTATGGGKAIELNAGGTANFSFSERRLPGAGRNAEALRMLRSYRSAEGTFEVEKDTTSLRLRDRRRLIVAQGRREGIAPYSPSGPLSRLELDLLQMPGDSLAMLSLLPSEPVAVGEKWSPESWGLQMLTYTEAVQDSSIECELVAVERDVARVRFTGTLKGATVGASTEMTVSGIFLFDIGAGHLARVEYEQVEKRSVGTVSPGMDVVAKVTVDRKPAVSTGELTDAAVERVPLDPPPALLLLTFQGPGVQMLHDRNWHVFRQSGQVAVLRLLDKGSFVAQCNLTQVTPAAPGSHTPEDQFQADIRKVLGKQLKSIEKAEQLQTDNGQFLYRVTAVGETPLPGRPDPVPMTWLYYLCAAPNGQQVSFVFSVESKLVEPLGNRDLSMVKSLQFLNSSPPTASTAE